MTHSTQINFASDLCDNFLPSFQYISVLDTDKLVRTHADKLQAKDQQENCCHSYLLTTLLHLLLTFPACKWEKHFNFLFHLPTNILRKLWQLLPAQEGSGCSLHAFHALKEAKWTPTYQATFSLHNWFSGEPQPITIVFTLLHYLSTFSNSAQIVYNPAHINRKL